MSKLEEIIKYNESFVGNKDYQEYVTTKIPKKKMAILSCMDTRLT
jgi:carbonic anhydrase